MWNPDDEQVDEDNVDDHGKAKSSSDSFDSEAKMKNIHDNSSPDNPRDRLED